MSRGHAPRQALLAADRVLENHQNSPIPTRSQRPWPCARGRRHRRGRWAAPRRRSRCPPPAPSTGPRRPRRSSRPREVDVAAGNRPLILAAWRPRIAVLRSPGPAHVAPPRAALGRAGPLEAAPPWGNTEERAGRDQQPRRCWYLRGGLRVARCIVRRWMPDLAVVLATLSPQGNCSVRSFADVSGRRSR